MKVNYRLKGALLDTVENQLRENNPRATKETFDRLVSSGYSKIKAKEMIASVVTEEIYHMLKNKRVFDEEKFIEKLCLLK